MSDRLLRSASKDQVTVHEGQIPDRAICIDYCFEDNLALDLLSSGAVRISRLNAMQKRAPRDPL